MDDFLVQHLVLAGKFSLLPSNPEELVDLFTPTSPEIVTECLNIDC